MPTIPRPLTKRQAEIMDLVAEGATIADIAQRMSVSPRTVGNHLHECYIKLGAANRVQAALAWERMSREADAA